MSFLWKTVEVFTGDDALDIILKIDKHNSSGNPLRDKYILWKTVNGLASVDTEDGGGYRVLVHRSTSVLLQRQRFFNIR